jgi:hypothetical protein
MAIELSAKLPSRMAVCSLLNESEPDQLMKNAGSSSNAHVITILEADADNLPIGLNASESGDTGTTSTKLDSRPSLETVSPTSYSCTSASDSGDEQFEVDLAYSKGNHDYLHSTGKLLSMHLINDDNLCFIGFLCR